MTSLSKPLILFDVDKTLIDTNLLIKSQVYLELQKLLNISTQELEQRELLYQNSLEKYTDFEPLSFIKSVSQQDDVTELASKTILNRTFHEQAVYDDVIPTLAELSEQYTLGVFSEANLNWQRQKLELSGLHHFFAPEFIFIWRRKTAPEQLAQLPSPVTIIDDNTEVITALQTVPSITPIWINRLDKPAISSVATISTLLELKNVLPSKGTHV